MRLLVFGKSGQLGHSLAARLAPHDPIMVGREQADLARPEEAAALIKGCAADVIINAAAYTAVDRAESEPQQARLINAEAPGLMAAAAREIGALFVHYSTDYVFPGDASQPYREQDPTGPRNVYGRSKLAGEQAVRAATDQHLIFRTSWVYSNTGNNFLKTMLRLAVERDELRVVADQLGTPTYAGSLAAASASLLERWLARERDHGLLGTYHMTCSGTTSWHGFAEEIMRQTGNGSIRVVPIATSEFPTPATRPAYSVLDNTKLAKNFQIRLPQWPDALRDCLQQRDDAARH